MFTYSSEVIYAIKECEIYDSSSFGNIPHQLSDHVMGSHEHEDFQPIVNTCRELITNVDSKIYRYLYFNFSIIILLSRNVILGIVVQHGLAHVNILTRILTTD